MIARRAVALLLVAAQFTPGAATIARAAAKPVAAAPAPAASPRGLQLVLPDSLARRSETFRALGKHALVIGVNRYEHESQGISPLRFAVGDAEAVQRALVDPRTGGFPPENVTLLTDLTAEKPTNTAIGRALNRLITSVNDSDLVVIYFSGHGYEQDGRAYLLPANADLDALDYSAIERDAFVRQLDRIPARKVVVVLDACHSGGVNRGGKGVGRDASLSEQYFQKFAGAQGRAFIASSSAGELSWEDEEAGHGVFTRAFTEGLGGSADRAPEDGIVTLEELRTYLESEVSNWAGRRGKVQHPQIQLESARGEIPLSMHHEYLDRQSRELQAKRDESEQLRTSLSHLEGLSPEETAAALDLVNRFGRGDVLDAGDAGHLEFVRRLAAGAISVDMYRAGAPKPRPALVDPAAIGLTPRKRSKLPWLLGGVGAAAAGVAVALGGGKSAPAGPNALPGPPDPPNH